MKKNRMLWTWLVLFALTAPFAIGASIALAETHGTMMPDGSFIADPVATAPPVATVPAVGTPATPTTNADGGHWWSGLLATVLSAAAAGLTALLAWLSNNAKNWVKQKASEANTKESAAWYATALYLAGIAVRFAYDKYGPETAKAEELRKEAARFLKDRLIAIDKDIVLKNPQLDSLIDGFVRAAYTDVFKVVSPLSSAPELKPA